MLRYSVSSGGPILAKRKRRAVSTDRRDGPDSSRAQEPRVSGDTSVLKLLALAGFFGALLVIYAPALDGEFISDDEHYIERNVFIQNPSMDNLAAILDPTSVVSILVENYAPVHLLLHAAQWQAFGDSVRGYHVVNLAVHALATWLLVLLFLRSGIQPVAAWMAGAFFLVHPANVEAVAWISQLKTSSALVLALLALLAHPRRPLLGTLCFALALLAKPTALVALPAVIGFGWARTRRGAEAPVNWHWNWVLAWVAVLLLFAVAEWAAFADTAGQAPPFYPEFDVRMRTTLAIALRYLVRAVTGQGVSVFQEPPAAEQWLDPWWLISVFVLALLAWRTVLTLRRRSEEAAWWLWSIAAFAPVSGVIPLPYPMADRYLYFMLPGLLGGVLLAGPKLGLASWQLLGRGAPPDRVRRGVPMALLLVVAIGIVFFSNQTWQRAHVWQRLDYFMSEAARNYPEGVVAKTRAASRAAFEGDSVTAIALLDDARARGYNRLDNVFRDPAYERIARSREFEAYIDAWALEEIERLENTSRPSQFSMRVIAQGYIVIDDLDAAEDSIRRGIEMDGPLGDELRRDLEQIERQKRIRSSRKPALD